MQTDIIYTSAHLPICTLLPLCSVAKAMAVRDRGLGALIIVFIVPLVVVLVIGKLIAKLVLFFVAFVLIGVALVIEMARIETVAA